MSDEHQIVLSLSVSNWFLRRDLCFVFLVVAFPNGDSGYQRDSLHVISRIPKFIWSQVLNRKYNSNEFHLVLNEFEYRLTQAVDCFSNLLPWKKLDLFCWIAIQAVGSLGLSKLLPTAVKTWEILSNRWPVDLKFRTRKVIVTANLNSSIPVGLLLAFLWFQIYYYYQLCVCSFPGPDQVCWVIFPRGN